MTNYLKVAIFTLSDQKVFLVSNKNMGLCLYIAWNGMHISYKDKLQNEKNQIFLNKWHNAQTLSKYKKTDTRKKIDRHSK